MSDYGIEVESYRRSYLDDVEITGERISSYNPNYNGYDVVNSVRVDNLVYTGKYITTEESSYIKNTAITYSNNALIYLYDIRPIKKPLLQYAMPKAEKEDIDKNSLKSEYEFDKNPAGYTGDPTKTQEYKDIKSDLELLSTMMETKTISKSQAIASALYSLFDALSLYNKKFYKLEDNTIYDTDTLKTKLKKYYSSHDKSDNIIDKLTNFLKDNGFKLNTNFKFTPSVLTSTIINNESSSTMALANSTRANIGDNKQMANMDYNVSIDTYDYMAGGKMYASFREPLVIGQKPQSTLETETSIFGGTQLLEKRFDLLDGLLESNYKQKEGENLWRNIDIKNKAKYIAQTVQYNKSVQEINKTNEMLTIFADKLEFLAYAYAMYASIRNNGLGYFGPTSDYYRYESLKKATEETIPHIQGISLSGTNIYNIVKDKFYMGVDGLYYWYNKYATHLHGYEANFLQRMTDEINALIIDSRNYQDELITWSTYMDSTYGIEV